MHLPAQRRSLAILAAASFGVFLSAASCQHATPVPDLSPEAQRVSQALKMWPEASREAAGIKRPFFATIHIAGRRVTASGLLDYHSPRDFRITAVTEMGVILFDVRVNWAGVTALRQMPGLDKSIVESLVRDLAVALAPPSSLNGLAQKGAWLVLKQAEADTNKRTWMFDPATGRMHQLDVDLGTFDTLRVDYLKFNAQGWPEELTVTRKARFYTIGITFSEGSIARHVAP